MSMEESLQTLIMRAIQEIMTRDGIGSSESLPGMCGYFDKTSVGVIDTQMKQMINDLEREKTEREQLYLKVRDLEMQV